MLSNFSWHKDLIAVNSFAIMWYINVIDFTAVITVNVYMCVDAVIRRQLRLSTTHWQIQKQCVTAVQLQNCKKTAFYLLLKCTNES